MFQFTEVKGLSEIAQLLAFLRIPSSSAGSSSERLKQELSASVSILLEDGRLEVMSVVYSERFTWRLPSSLIECSSLAAELSELESLKTPGAHFGTCV